MNRFVTLLESKMPKIIAIEMAVINKPMIKPCSRYLLAAEQNCRLLTLLKEMLQIIELSFLFTLASLDLAVQWNLCLANYFEYLTQD
jgi:hypothetical protein